jgi:hypothetical protein
MIVYDTDFFLIIVGERVSHLDKTDVYKAPPNQDEKEREQGDDYVLSRLVNSTHKDLQTAYEGKM